MKAFHFTNGMKLRDGEELIVGKTYRYEGEIEICKSGYHASINLFDALKYAPGFTLSLVECSDIVEEHDDKFVCRTRTVLETHNIRDEIILWVADCAEDALKSVKNPDPRSIAAIKAVRNFISGKITLDELKGLRSAARAAYITEYYTPGSTNICANSAAFYAISAAFYAIAYVYDNQYVYSYFNQYAVLDVMSGFLDATAGSTLGEHIKENEKKMIYAAKMKEYEQKLIESIQKKFENKLD